MPLPSSFSTEVKGASKEAIERLVKKKKVVVFMKGVPEEPKCGFSNAVVQILRMHGVSSYEAHDVLKDETIRQGPLSLRLFKESLRILCSNLPQQHSSALIPQGRMPKGKMANDFFF
jgi:hypothetical protein